MVQDEIQQHQGQNSFHLNLGSCKQWLDIQGNWDNDIFHCDTVTIDTKQYFTLHKVDPAIAHEIASTIIRVGYDADNYRLVEENHLGLVEHLRNLHASTEESIRRARQALVPERTFEEELKLREAIASTDALARRAQHEIEDLRREQERLNNNTNNLSPQLITLIVLGLLVAGTYLLGFAMNSAQRLWTFMLPNLLPIAGIAVSLFAAKIVGSYIRNHFKINAYESIKQFPKSHMTPEERVAYKSGVRSAEGYTGYFSSFLNYQSYRHITYFLAGEYKKQLKQQGTSPRP